MHRHDGPHRTVDRTVLHHISPRGGSYDESLTISRLDRLVREGISGEDLYALMVKIAEDAAEDGSSQAHNLRFDVVHSLKSINEHADSNRLALYIEKLSQGEALF